MAKKTKKQQKAGGLESRADRLLNPPPKKKDEEQMLSSASMSNGFLAFIDILGFRKGVMGYESIMFVENYLDTIKTIIAPIQDKHQDNIHLLVVSDSIILTTVESEPLSFIRVCSELYFELVACGFPIRGAVSYGSFKREVVGKDGGSIFIAGPALVEAYEIENAQNWMGIAVAPSAQTTHFDLFSNLAWLPPKSELATYVQFIEDLPLKIQNEKKIKMESYVIYPRRSSESKFKDIDFIVNLKKMILGTIDPAVRQKYNNTLSHIEAVHNKFGNYHGPVDMKGIEAIKNILADNIDIGFPPEEIENWYRKLVGENKPVNNILDEINSHAQSFRNSMVIDQANELLE